MTNRLPALLEKDLRFIFFGGKGGVGKTTSAVAGALYLAEWNPNKKMLMVSTDPAHSLGDSLDQYIGDRVVAVQGVDRLFAREAVFAQEIDAPILLVDFKRRYRESIAEIFNSILGGEAKLEFDQDVMERLLDLSPPGIDEVMALIEVMELMAGREFDIFVLDAAPTGHLLLFLEMPDIARDWLGAAMKVSLKYQDIGRLGSVAGLVMNYSKQVRKLRKQLFDTAGTEIIVVTIPEAMGVVGMKRLLQALSRFKIACRQIVINMGTPPNDCSYCSLKRDEEQGYVREVIAQCPDLRVGFVPRLPRPVRGIRSLLEFRRILYATKAEDNSVPS